MLRGRPETLYTNGLRRAIFKAYQAYLTDQLPIKLIGN